MKPLNKLVRDKVPSLVTKDGGSYTLKLLSPLEHQNEISKKLLEEVQEYAEAPSKDIALEELVDVVELIYAALKLHDVSAEDFEKMRLAKKKLKGGFEKGIFLNTITKD